MNYKGFLLVCILSFFIGTLSSQPKLLQRNSSQIPETYSKLLHNEHRKLLNLNGEWQFVSADENIRTNVQVPFCYDFKGKSSCSREFNIDLDNFKSYNYIIVCDGVNYQCEVSINGSFIVKHEGGFTGFSSLILDGILKETSNHIEIRIDNTLDLSRTLPLSDNPFFPKNYGGIYRDIYILAVPKIFIKGVNVNSEIDLNFNADISNTISISTTDYSTIQGVNSDNKFSIKTEIVDTSGTVKSSSGDLGFTIATNSTIQVKNDFILNSPQLWSPDNPQVYRLRVILSYASNVIDVFETDFGVYEVNKKPSSIVINRTELRIKGVNYVEEFPLQGIAGSYQDVERDIKNLKMLGCNVIKVLGRAASPYLINICNRYGIFIIEEISVFNAPPGICVKENFISLAQNQLNEMITSHKSNPCILAYGFGNDINVSDERTKSLISKLSETAKNLDKRIIYYSSRNLNNDICSELVDMVGLNFYDGDINVLKEIVSSQKVKKQRIFISCFGKNINPNNFSGYSDPSSIESQSKFIVDLNKIIKTSNFLGSNFLTYSDWNADNPNLNYFNRENHYLRTTGLFGLGREQRSSATIFKKINLEEDIPNLNIGTYSKEAPVIFVILGLFTFVLFIYLANSVRRFRENVWRAMFRPFIFFTDVREQNLISSFYNLLLALILSVSTALFFANLFYFWKDSQSLDIILSVIISSPLLKSILNGLMSNPLKITLLLMVIAFLKILFITIIIWFFSLASKFRIGFNNIFTTVVWGMLPVILLLVAGTFYIRILNENDDFVIIGLGLVLFIYSISIYRILKGVYIIFDSNFLKTYAYGAVVIAVISGSAWFYLNSTKFISDYFGLIFSFIRN